jgi:N-ethylmaleimide reductase
VTYPLLAKALAERNVAWLHIIKPAGSAYGQWDEIRANFPGTIILNGGLTKPTGEALIDSKAAELVSYGGLFIANPDLPERFAAGATLAAPDPSTFYTPGPEGFTTYPSL